MRSLAIRRFISIATFLCLGSLLPPISIETASVSATQEASVPQEKGSPDQGVPAYHEGPPDAELPPVLDPKQFDQEVVQTAYRLAADLAKTLYQQPCYCYCDRHHNHTSLLECYATKHTAGCGTCLQELFYVYEQTNKGQTPAQIREGIIRGEWKTIDIKQYQKAHPAERIAS